MSDIAVKSVIHDDSGTILAIDPSVALTPEGKTAAHSKPHLGLRSQATIGASLKRFA